jgi:hypothetical protein
VNVAVGKTVGQTVNALGKTLDKILNLNFSSYLNDVVKKSKVPNIKEKNA